MSRLQTDKNVFHLWLSKTGTSTLTDALNILGIRTIHYPHDEQTFGELKRGDYRLSVFRDYQGVTHTPVAPFYAQLDQAWPGSKFYSYGTRKGLRAAVGRGSLAPPQRGRTEHA